MKYKKGDIIIIEFPFSNIIDSKIRPCLVLANLDGEDILVAKITSKMDNFKKYSVEINSNSLENISYIKLDSITTLLKENVLKKIDEIDSHIIENVDNKLKEVFKL